MLVLVKVIDLTSTLDEMEIAFYTTVIDISAIY